MCDPSTMFLMSGAMQLGGGIAAGVDARSQANFEAAQLEAQKTLLAAKQSRQEGELRRQFNEMSRSNLAAIAVSGLNPASFAGITKGNKEEMQRVLATNDNDTRFQQRQLDAEKAAVKINGNSRARAAMLQGITGAMGSIYDYEMSYRNLFDKSGSPLFHNIREIGGGTFFKKAED